MKDDQVIVAIDNFISHRLYNYALMLNGAWGCGKTFFIEKVLIPHLKECKIDVNYISLYGIKNPEEIATKLCERAIRDKITKTTGKNTEGKGAQIATLVMGQLLKYGVRKLDLEVADIKSAADLLPNYDNNVIIVDDLERCQCDVCAVLGYINDFVEHSNASVIIVANEKEIGQVNSEENQELQMLVALNGRLNVKLPPASFAEAYQAKNKGDNNALEPFLTPEQVHRARKYIFQNSEQYRRTKEKVIGLTLDYIPDLKSVFSSLIDDCIKNAELNRRLRDKVDEFVSIAESTKHQNIRTFLFFLEKMQQIFAVIDENSYPVIQMVAIYCYRSSVSRMKGEKPPEWKDSEFGVQSFGMGISREDHLYGFKFIDELITSNTIDGRSVSKELSDYCAIEVARGSLESDPYQKLKTWYECNDKELCSALQDIKLNISNGKYSTRIFPDIVHYLVYFKRMGLNTKLCDEIIDSMQEFIRQASKEKIEPFVEERYILEGEDLQTYTTIMERISSCLEKSTIQTEEKYWKSIFEKKEWPEELLTAVRKHNQCKHSFVYWINPVDLYELIRRSSNKQIFILRQAIQEVYARGYYYTTEIDDLSHLQELDELLKDTNEMEHIQAAHCGWIRNDLKKYIDKISSRIPIVE